jgi:hypothetical protein
MPDNPAIPIGLKLNELAKFEVGPGVILLALKDAGRNAQTASYSDLYDTVERCLAPRLERYGISNPQQIVDRLLGYMQAYQSVFTLSAH